MGGQEEEEWRDPKFFGTEEVYICTYMYRQIHLLTLLISSAITV
jgi:hypothetical protein